MWVLRLIYRLICVGCVNSVVYANIVCNGHLMLFCVV